MKLKKKINIVYWLMDHTFSGDWQKSGLHSDECRNFSLCSMSIHNLEKLMECLLLQFSDGIR